MNKYMFIKTLPYHIFLINIKIIHNESDNYA